MRSRRLHGARAALAVAVVVGVGAVALGLWATSALSGHPGPGTGSRERAASVGRLPPGRTLHVALALSGRHEARLRQLIAAGRTVSSSRFDRAFLPSAPEVRAGIRQLERAGLSASWSPGSTVIEAAGPVRSVEAAFSVSIARFRDRRSRVYYAPVGQPILRGALHGLISTVTGLSDENRLYALSSQPTGAVAGHGCGAGAGGYEPNQILSAYNFAPLSRAGLTGAGQTVVFIEEDTYGQADLACARQRFAQPPYNLTVAPARWGKPTPISAASGSESDLDLEVVHAVAPGARLVVYETDGTVGEVAAAFAAAASAYPKGIMSISLGGCEVAALNHAGDPIASPDETVWHSALQRLAATGGSAFISSGDAGAFECGTRFRNPGSGEPLPVVSSPAVDPFATAVGGTTLFLGAGSTYAGEGAWGSPFEASGSGGGLSNIWTQPSYQSGPGVHNGYSDGSRQVPDVAALGDPSTGWEIAQAGTWGVVGGTSAAAPLWAGLTALGDEALGRLHLARIGFANPALYALGRTPSRWPAPAYNDVTQGKNLLYPATPGWDFATGWGSPNAAGLVDDLVAYQRTRR